MSLVNVLEPLRQSQGPRQMRFLPLTGTVVPAPEARLPRAFAFQGRQFVMANARADAQRNEGGSVVRTPGAATRGSWVRIPPAQAVLSLKLPMHAKWKAGDQHRPPSQTVVYLRAGIDAANGPAWAAPTEHRWSRRSPVLIPHAPSSESKRRYTEAPQGDKTRPIRRVPVAAVVAREDGPSWFSEAQVGHGWRTDLRKLLSGARSSGKGSVRSP
jgi:hypothetical protein